jgi:hypothetical protein
MQAYESRRAPRRGDPRIDGEPMIAFDSEIKCKSCGIAHPSSVEYRRRPDGSMSRLCRECWQAESVDSAE